MTPSFIHFCCNGVLNYLISKKTSYSSMTVLVSITSRMNWDACFEEAVDGEIPIC